MWNWIGDFSEVTHPTRRGFLQIFWAAMLPKPPIDFWQISDIIDVSSWNIDFWRIDSSLFDAVFHTRLGLKWDERMTFLKRLNAALAERNLPVFWEIDLDNQALWIERRRIVKEWFEKSLQQRWWKNITISQLMNLRIPWAENQKLKIDLEQYKFWELIRNFWKTWIIPEDTELWMRPTLSFSLWDEHIEIRIFDWQAVFSKDTRYAENPRPKREDLLYRMRWNTKDILRFLEKSANDISCIIEENGMTWETDYKGRMRELWYNDEIEWVWKFNKKEFLNSTALTPIAHIKNRIYDVIQDAPQDFPLSFAVQEMLWKTELDVKVLINNISHL